MNEEFINPEQSINEQSGQQDDTISSDRRQMFFNKRNHSSKFNELKIMIENSQQAAKPQTSHANQKGSPANFFEEETKQPQQQIVKKRRKKQTQPIYSPVKDVKEKKTVSFKFSPNQVASFVGESNLDKITKPDQSPIEVGNFRQVEVIPETENEERTPRNQQYLGSPGIIFRKKREFPEGGGLNLQMMPMGPSIMQPNRKKYFNQSNPKLQMRFDSKFTKIRQFQSDIDNLIQENQQCMNQLKSIKKNSIQPMSTNTLPQNNLATHNAQSAPKKTQSMVPDKYQSVRSSSNSFNRSTNLAHYLMGQKRQITPHKGQLNDKNTKLDTSYSEDEKDELPKLESQGESRRPEALLKSFEQMRVAPVKFKTNQNFYKPHEKLNYLMHSQNYEDKFKYRAQTKSQQNQRGNFNAKNLQNAQPTVKKPQKKSISQFQAQIMNFKDETRNQDIQRRLITQDTLLQSGQLSRQSIDNGASMDTPVLNHYRSPEQTNPVKLNIMTPETQTDNVTKLININDELEEQVKSSPKFYIAPGQKMLKIQGKDITYRKGMVQDSMASFGSVEKIQNRKRDQALMNSYGVAAPYLPNNSKFRKEFNQANKSQQYYLKHKKKIIQAGTVSPNKNNKKNVLIYHEPPLKINYGSSTAQSPVPRTELDHSLMRGDRESAPQNAEQIPKSLRVNKRDGRQKETNLMILFNNETMILGQKTQQSRSKNTSKMDEQSPRKPPGVTSARNANYCISNRKTGGTSKQRRDQIDPIDLIDALNEKSVDAIDKNQKQI